MLDWLEARLGRYAVPHAIRGIALLYLVCFLLETLKPGFVGMLTLEPELVRAGQFWRLFTYALIPSSLSPIWILFVIMIMWLIGEGIEDAFGPFKTNVYLFIGVFGTATAAMFLGLPDVSGQYLYLSLFFAFATLYPEYEILLFFILPVRVKWLALFSAVFVAVAFVNGAASAKLAIACALANYILFFGPIAVRAASAMAKVRARRAKFEARKLPEDEPLHRCAKCGCTERDDDALDFRVASDGEEYCTAHLPQS